MPPKCAIQIETKLLNQITTISGGLPAHGKEMGAVPASSKVTHFPKASLLAKQGTATAVVQAMDRICAAELTHRFLPARYKSPMASRILCLTFVS